jgi:hypothetical protein
MRYDGSAAGSSGDGYDVRRDNGGVSSGLTEAIEAGREGNSWDRRSEPDVCWRVRAGRACGVGVPLLTAGDPARKAVGTRSSDAFLAMAGEPACSGEGTSFMAVSRAPIELSSSGIKSAGLQLVRACRGTAPTIACLRYSAARATWAPWL